jgi:hypothetical protein
MSEHSQARKRTEDWLKKNSLGGVGEEGLAYQLPDYGLLDYFVWGVSSMQASQLNQGPDPKDEGCDGVP